MVKIRLHAFSILAALLVSGSGFASTASWWMLCDWCESDSDFQHQALNAPGEYTPIYVTNRETNDTRKFDRFFIVNDLEGGIEQQVIVTATEFPAAEKTVFEEAVQNANIIFIRIPRSDLVGLVGGLGSQSSVVGDISTGSVDNRVVTAAGLSLEIRRVLPSRLSVNAEAGAQIAGTGGNVGAGETIRVKDLAIEIVYEDGSTMSFRRRGSDGAFVDFSATDADGDATNIDGPPERTVNPGAFVGREFNFGGPNAQFGALGLMDFLTSEAGLQCSASINEIDGVEVVTVICHRP